MQIMGCGLSGRHEMTEQERHVPKYEDDRRIIKVTLSAHEYNWLVAEVHSKGQSLGAYIRERVLPPEHRQAPRRPGEVRDDGTT